MTQDKNELADAKRDAALASPVAWLVDNELAKGTVRSAEAAEKYRADGYTVTPLYSTPAAALPGAVQPVAVAVKELEWGQTSYGTPEAHSVVGVYRINNAWNGGWTVVIGREVLRDVSGRENFADVDAAKAAAQAHFETRIRSSLIPATMAGEGDVAKMNDDEIAKWAERFGAGVAWANDPDEFHHLIEFTPPQLRDAVRAALANPRLREEPK